MPAICEDAICSWPWTKDSQSSEETRHKDLLHGCTIIKRHSLPPQDALAPQQLPRCILSELWMWDEIYRWIEEESKHTNAATWAWYFPWKMEEFRYSRPCESLPAECYIRGCENHCVWVGLEETKDQRSPWDQEVATSWTRRGQSGWGHNMHNECLECTSFQNGVRKEWLTSDYWFLIPLTDMYFCSFIKKIYPWLRWQRLSPKIRKWINFLRLLWCCTDVFKVINHKVTKWRSKTT